MIPLQNLTKYGTYEISPNMDLSLLLPDILLAYASLPSLFPLPSKYTQVLFREYIQIPLTLLSFIDPTLSGYWMCTMYTIIVIHICFVMISLDYFVLLIMLTLWMQLLCIWFSIRKTYGNGLLCWIFLNKNIIMNN